MGVGVGNGIAAFLIVAVVITVFMFVELGNVSTGGAQTFEWLVYIDASLLFSSPVGAVHGRALNLMSGSSSIPSVVYYLVPVLGLVLFGHRAANAGRAPSNGAGGASQPTQRGRRAQGAGGGARRSTQQSAPAQAGNPDGGGAQQAQTVQGGSAGQQRAAAASCPGCGATVDPRENFCRECGASI